MDCRLADRDDQVARGDQRRMPVEVDHRVGPMREMVLCSFEGDRTVLDGDERAALSSDFRPVLQGCVSRVSVCLVCPAAPRDADVGWRPDAGEPVLHFGDGGRVRREKGGAGT
ncbi:hypothetical protein UFOVP1244_33 [uncultured Caudovirales phage]|uniref:Uncharacterized protein n=1 Tax=uncultured Caudovirales phage TaxID=2100421 RepID=A0A6J5RDG8_9CAUD|nr:hypothetical protein UFOVP1244_33 [uncultured Caudovirales phage]